jgi:hypothetical protein
VDARVQLKFFSKVRVAKMNPSDIALSVRNDFNPFASSIDMPILFTRLDRPNEGGWVNLLETMDTNHKMTQKAKKRVEWELVHLVNFVVHRIYVNIFRSFKQSDTFCRIQEREHEWKGNQLIASAVRQFGMPLDPLLWDVVPSTTALKDSKIFVNAVPNESTQSVFPPYGIYLPRILLSGNNIEKKRVNLFCHDKREFILSVFLENPFTTRDVITFDDPLKGLYITLDALGAVKTTINWVRVSSKIINGLTAGEFFAELTLFIRDLPEDVDSIDFKLSISLSGPSDPALEEMKWNLKKETGRLLFIEQDEVPFYERVISVDFYWTNPSRALGADRDWLTTQKHDDDVDIVADVAITLRNSPTLARTSFSAFIRTFLCGDFDDSTQDAILNSICLPPPIPDTPEWFFNQNIAQLLFSSCYSTIALVEQRLLLSEPIVPTAASLDFDQLPTLEHIKFVFDQVSFWKTKGKIQENIAERLNQLNAMLQPLSNPSSRLPFVFSLEKMGQTMQLLDDKLLLAFTAAAQLNAYQPENPTKTSKTGIQRVKYMLNSMLSVSFPARVEMFPTNTLEKTFWGTSFLYNLDSPPIVPFAALVSWLLDRGDNGIVSELVSNLFALQLTSRRMTDGTAIVDQILPRVLALGAHLQHAPAYEVVVEAFRLSFFGSLSQLGASSVVDQLIQEISLLPTSPPFQAAITWLYLSFAGFSNVQAHLKVPFRTPVVHPYPDDELEEQWDVLEGYAQQMGQGNDDLAAISVMSAAQIVMKWCFNTNEVSPISVMRFLLHTPPIIAIPAESTGTSWNMQESMATFEWNETFVKKGAFTFTVSDERLVGFWVAVAFLCIASEDYKLLTFQQIPHLGALPIGTDVATKRAALVTLGKEALSPQNLNAQRNGTRFSIPFKIRFARAKEKGLLDAMEDLFIDEEPNKDKARVQ